VHSAALPGGTDEHLLDRAYQSEVVIGDDKPDTSEPALAKRSEKRSPKRPVLGVADVTSEHLAVAIGGDSGDDDDRSRDDTGTDSALHVGGVTEQIGEGDVIELSLPEAVQVLVELGTDPRHLGLGDPRRDAEGFDQVIDLSRRDAVHVGLHHHGEQRSVDPSPALEDVGEEALTLELRDPELDVAALVESTRGRWPLR
jgi:hypothetical protein